MMTKESIERIYIPNEMKRVMSRLKISSALVILFAQVTLLGIRRFFKLFDGVPTVALSALALQKNGEGYRIWGVDGAKVRYSEFKLNPAVFEVYQHRQVYYRIEGMFELELLEKFISGIKSKDKEEHVNILLVVNPIEHARFKVPYWLILQYKDKDTLIPVTIFDPEKSINLSLAREDGMEVVFKNFVLTEVMRIMKKYGAEFFSIHVSMKPEASVDISVDGGHALIHIAPDLIDRIRSISGEQEVECTFDPNFIYSLIPDWMDLITWRIKKREPLRIEYWTKFMGTWYHVVAPRLEY